MEIIQEKMRLNFIFLSLLMLIPFVSAHSGLYHNYAGGGSGFYILLLVLIISLVIYEKLGDTSLGLSILWIGILVPLYVDLFYPQNDELTIGMVMGIVIIILVSFIYNYSKRVLK